MREHVADDQLSRKQRFGWPIPLLVSSAAFAIVHGSGFAGHFIAGLVLGVLYLRTYSLWPGIVAHATNNIGLLAILLLF